MGKWAEIRLQRDAYGLIVNRGQKFGHQDVTMETVFAAMLTVVEEVNLMPFLSSYAEFADRSGALSLGRSAFDQFQPI